jgi:hypothetical protein
MKFLKLLLIATIIFPIFFVTAQDNGDDSESAAEASITGSASQPSVTAPGSIEGNPLVIAVRSGLISLDDALKLGLGKIRDLAAAGGDFDALIRSVNSAGDVDIDLIRKLNDLSLDEELLSAALKVAAAYDSSDLKNQEALIAAASVAKGFLTDRTITSTESLESIASINVGDFTESGYNIALVEILNKYGAIGQKGNSLLDAEFGSSRSLSTALTAESSTAGYLDLLSTLTGGRSLTETVLGSSPADVDLSKPTASVIDVPMENVNLAPGANITIGATSSSGPDYSNGYAPDSIDGLTWLITEGWIDSSGATNYDDPETITTKSGLTEEIHDNPFAESIITFSTAVGSIVLDIDEDGMTTITEDGITSESFSIPVTQDPENPNIWTAKAEVYEDASNDGFYVFGISNTATFNFETKEGTITHDGEVPDGYGVFSFTQKSTSGSPYIYNKTGPNEAQITLTFANEDNPEPEVTTLTFTSPNEGTLEWVEYSDAEMTQKGDDGGTGFFELAESSKRELPVVAGPSSVDVSKYLTKNHDNSVYVIGAAKDMNIVSDVTFKNSNTEEDHALVLGAADDFMINGNSDSDRINVTYEGSNLALGSGGTEADSMYLVNTNITTGGNLAAGTLGTLNITNATINVGNGGLNSDPDNVYLYANDLIDISNLRFSDSRLDDVYMEAITVVLSDVEFPSSAQVHARSRDGTLHFGEVDNKGKITKFSRETGAVNLNKVSHGAINNGAILTKNDFSKTNVGYKSNTTLPTGYNAFTISSQKRGD